MILSITLSTVNVSAMSYKIIDGVGYWCMDDREKEDVETIVKGIRSMGWEVDRLREENKKLQKQAYDVILKNEALHTRNKIITLTAIGEGLLLLIAIGLGVSN